MGEENYGLHVWPCAKYLSGFILANESEFKDKIVLEIGCGTALAGLTSAKCGAKRVILTDKDDERLKRLINLNINQNGLCNESVTVEFRSLVWGKLNQDLFSLPEHIDVIIGSDCFYDPSVFETVLITVSYLINRHKGVKFYFSYQERSADWNMEILLKKWKLKCVKLPYYCDNSSIFIGLITLNEFISRMFKHFISDIHASWVGFDIFERVLFSLKMYRGTDDRACLWFRFWTPFLSQHADDSEIFIQLNIDFDDVIDYSIAEIDATCVGVLLHLNPKNSARDNMICINCENSHTSEFDVEYKVMENSIINEYCFETIRATEF